MNVAQKILLIESTFMIFGVPLFNNKKILLEASQDDFHIHKGVSGLVLFPCTENKHEKKYVVEILDTGKRVKSEKKVPHSCS